MQEQLPRGLFVALSTKGSITTSGWERQAPAWRMSALINIAEQGFGVPGYLSVVPS